LFTVPATLRWVKNIVPILVDPDQFDYLFSYFFVQLEQYNILLELQILTKKYFDVVKVLNRHCGLVFDNQIIDLLDLKDSKELKFNQVLPLDILAKLCIALIHCERSDFALPMISTFLAANVEDFGDIYLDVAEVLMESGQNEPAIPLLEMVIQSNFLMF